MQHKYKTYDKILTFVAFQQPQLMESRLIQNNLKGHHLVWKKNNWMKL